jgi:hypothetical protein
MYIPFWILGPITLGLTLFWLVGGAFVYIVEDYGGEKPKGCYILSCGPISWVMALIDYIKYKRITKKNEKYEKSKRCSSKN